MKSRGQIWTADERQQLLDLLRAGVSYVEVARRLDRTEKACRLQAYRERQAGQVAAGPGRGGAGAAGPWTAEQRQQLLDDLRAGVSYAEVARRLARTEEACRTQAKNLRIAGLTAVGATRPRADAAVPPRRCLACRSPFAPISRWVFRCDPCRTAARSIAA